MVQALIPGLSPTEDWAMFARKGKNAEWIGQFLAINCQVGNWGRNNPSIWATDIQGSIPRSLFRALVLQHVFPICKFPQCRAIGECGQISSTSKLQDTVYVFYCTAIYLQETDEAFSIRWHFHKVPIAKRSGSHEQLSEGDPRSTKQMTIKPRLILGILHVSLLLFLQGVKLMLCKDC